MDHAETVESVQVQLDIARVRMEKVGLYCFNLPLFSFRSLEFSQSKGLD